MNKTEANKIIKAAREKLAELRQQALDNALLDAQTRYKAYEWFGDETIAALEKRIGELKRGQLGSCEMFDRDLRFKVEQILQNSPFVCFPYKRLNEELKPEEIAMYLKNQDYVAINCGGRSERVKLPEFESFKRFAVVFDEFLLLWAINAKSADATEAGERFLGLVLRYRDAIKSWHAAMTKEEAEKFLDDFAAAQRQLYITISFRNLPDLADYEKGNR